MTKFLIALLFGCAVLSLHAEEPISTPKTEQTLVLIKPEAVANKHAGAILSRLEETDLKIIALRMTQFNQSKAAKFYAQLKKKPYFQDLTAYMKSGPLVAVVLEGPNAVAKVRTLIGATDPKLAAKGTIRAQFGTDIQHNAVHASESEAAAQREISQLFDSRQIFAMKSGALAPVTLPR